MATMYDVASMRMREPKVCRVFGLTSPAGQLLNGLSGKVISAKDPAHAGEDERLPVKLDGIPDAKSLKRANLDIAPDSVMELAVGVGREELQGFRCDPTQPALEGGLFLSIADRKVQFQYQSLFREKLRDMVNARRGGPTAPTLHLLSSSYVSTPSVAVLD